MRFGNTLGLFSTTLLGLVSANSTTLTGDKNITTPSPQFRKSSPPTAVTLNDLNPTLVPDTYRIILKHNVTQSTLDMILGRNAPKTAWRHADWANEIQNGDRAGLAGAGRVFGYSLGDIQGYVGEFGEKITRQIEKEVNVSVKPLMRA
jgi:hypothetical protein